jgi:hypothetical protein
MLYEVSLVKEDATIKHVGESHKLLRNIMQISVVLSCTTRGLVFR